MIAYREVVSAASDPVPPTGSLQKSARRIELERECTKNAIYDSAERRRQARLVSLDPDFLLEYPSCRGPTNSQRLREEPPLISWSIQEGDAEASPRHSVLLMQTYLVRHQKRKGARAQVSLVSARLLVKYVGPSETSEHSWLNSGLPLRLRILRPGGATQIADAPPSFVDVQCRLRTESSPGMRVSGDDIPEPEMWFSYQCDRMQIETTQTTLGMEAQIRFDEGSGFHAEMQALYPDLSIFPENKSLTLCEFDQTFDRVKSDMAAIVTMVDADILQSQDNAGNIKDTRTAAEKLIEWIGYHLAMGAARIFLYVDNGECDRELQYFLHRFLSAHLVYCLPTYRLHVYESENEQEDDASGKHVAMVSAKEQQTSRGLRWLHELATFTIHMDRFRYSFEYMLFVQQDEFLAFRPHAHAVGTDDGGDLNVTLFDIQNRTLADSDDCAFHLNRIYLDPPSRDMRWLPRIESQFVESYEEAGTSRGSLTLFDTRNALFYAQGEMLPSKCKQKNVESDVMLLARLSSESFESNSVPENNLQRLSQPRIFDVLRQREASTRKFLKSLGTDLANELDVRRLNAVCGTYSLPREDPFGFRESFPNATVYSHTRIRTITDAVLGTAAPASAGARTTSCTSAQSLAEEFGPLMNWGDPEVVVLIDENGPEHVETHQIFLLDVYLVRAENISIPDNRMGTSEREYSVHFYVKYRGFFQRAAYSWLNQGLPFRLSWGSQTRDVACYLDPPPVMYNGEKDEMIETWFGYHCDTVLIESDDEYGRLENASIYVTESDQQLLSKTSQRFVSEGARGLTICEWDVELGILPPTHASNEVNATFALVTMVDPRYSAHSAGGRSEPSSLERLPEWLAYHFSIGFGHATVYVDGTVAQTEAVRDHLRRFVRTGRVCVFPSFRNRVLWEKPQSWMRLSPPLPTQVLRMRDHQRHVFGVHLDRFARYHHAILVSDVDEFLIINRTALLTSSECGDCADMSALDVLMMWWSGHYAFRGACEMRFVWWHYEMQPVENGTSDAASSSEQEVGHGNGTPLLLEQFGYRRLRWGPSDRGASKALTLANYTTFYSNQHGAYKYTEAGCTSKYIRAEIAHLAHLRRARVGMDRNPLEPQNLSSLASAIRETLLQFPE
ncbi:hypothetical protein FVE85_8602 [Porphyridium purpureum]|uniref:Glycosyltransferase family 92 protein n=1 Tax=Porphyridium purpureum TaxID=35688 RepID=A0A5J4YRV5_PORPP|nr:hypothetical protein FVE85_8602 [Porphyridium purpureum]|eukprot:POR3230..scf296_7